MTHPVQSLNKRLRPSAIFMAAAAFLLGASPIYAANGQTIGSSAVLYEGSHFSSGPVATASAKKTAETAFAQVIAGTYYSVGLRNDGSVWTWGRNLFGELGLPGTTAVSSINAPVRLSQLADILSIASSGAGYQLAVKNDGTVWEWGQNIPDSRETLPPRQLPLLTDVAQVATRHSVSYALKQDGSLWAWTLHEQTGVSGKPVQIKLSGKIVSLGAAEDIAYALDKAGTVWIIQAERKDGQITVLPPSRVSGLPALKQVAGGSSRDMYGIDQTGTAWKWSLIPSAATYKLSGNPIKLYPGLKFKQVAGNDPVLLTEQGEVWGWGANQWNEVGVPRNSIDGMEYAPKRLQLPITVTVNGQLMASSFPATMTNNLISVPLKDVARALGAELTAPTVENGGAYTLNYNQKSATFSPNHNEVDIDGHKVQLSSPVTAVNGATMIPVSLIKQMGIGVAWDSKLALLAITSRS
ncbi:stalk domain-containing protein [Paenibacillus sp. VCA1]|uniref:stalk domain-containing protein n=1 Tax=Paenibacillus sp. VCA1 TaxID=3039148 RepID=UPI002872AC53|nr:stalk domain-containing protein [Paenibacillus sp. VCA1]MDR9855264.1 stalk domain-containing protein [Paenibacillus sp. VCA1]